MPERSLWLTQSTLSPGGAEMMLRAPTEGIDLEEIVCSEIL
jgi:hypothetical protein